MNMTELDLSESRVSDQILMKIYSLIFNEELYPAGECIILRRNISIKVSSINTCNYITIFRTGSIYIYDEFHWHMLPSEVLHLLYGTQWINPSERMPEDGQKVVIKTNSGIYQAEYYVDEIDNGKQLFDLDLQINNPIILQTSDIIGWLPVGKVTL